MCSPKVAEIVAARIAKEGRPQLSRRNLIKLGGATVAGAALTGMGAPSRKASAQAQSAGGYTVVDLTHVFSVTQPVYTLEEVATRETYLSVENDGYFIQHWTFYEHSGTHVDFPAHFIADGQTVDQYDAGLLYAPAVVIDITAKAAENADSMLEVADIEAHEAEHGEIVEGAIVFMNSGWTNRWPEANFRNADDAGVQHYPGFSGEAVTWLIENRNINGIGVDTLSLDPGNSTTFDAHYVVCGSGKFGIENVANVDQIQGIAGVQIVVGVPRWEASGGGPARILALVPVQA